jgi:hypothetical protein
MKVTKGVLFIDDGYILPNENIIEIVKEVKL